MDDKDECFEISVMFGKLKLDQLNIYDTKINMNELNLVQNDNVKLCY